MPGLNPYPQKVDNFCHAFLRDTYCSNRPIAELEKVKACPANQNHRDVFKNLPKDQPTGLTARLEITVQLLPINRHFPKIKPELVWIMGTCNKTFD